MYYQFIMALCLLGDELPGPASGSSSRLKDETGDRLELQALSKTRGWG